MKKPVKVILSRKGFDSSYGGHPSLIINNTELISLPIPDKNDYRKYNEVKTKDGTALSDIFKSLGIIVRANGDKNIETCHLDPDICDWAIDRTKEKAGCFGQVGSAQGKLTNSHIEIGDIFLFFGWFADVEKIGNDYKYLDREGKHVIFGYLQVGKIINVQKDKIPEEYKEHPHVLTKDDARLDDDRNTLYIASERFSFNKKYKGYGMFKFDEELVLSNGKKTKRYWKPFMKFNKDKVSIAYHSDKSWHDDYFESTCRGQEFVIASKEDVTKGDENATKWAIELIKKYSINK